MFATETELIDALGEFAVLGKIDVSFPAMVVAVDQAQDELRFANGPVEHMYPGFTGYELRAVHLQSQGRRGVLVLRSRQRRAAGEVPAGPR